MQSYDLVAELWRQAGSIRLSARHQRKDVGTGCVVQWVAAGPPRSRNRIGPRTEHCGTPNFITVGCEFELPQRTCCVRPSRYEANQTKTESPKPYDVRRRSKSVEWSTVSKAADRSNKVRTARSPLSTARSMSASILSSANCLYIVEYTE